MSGGALRIAVALSGGVDSSVTALFLQRCVRTGGDLEALWHTSAPSASQPVGSAAVGPGVVPDFPTVLRAVKQAIPWASVVAASSPRPPTAEGRPGILQRCRLGHSDTPVTLFPFYMHNWHDDTDGRSNGWCVAAERDYHDAQAVAHSLGLVPRDRRLTIVDLSAAYAERCFEPLLAAYRRGSTLNVDVLCNREVKFGALVEEHLGWGGQRHRGGFSPFGKYPCELLATGHYARTVWVELPRGVGVAEAGGPEAQLTALLGQPLSARADLNDQSLFLAQVRPALWRRAVFPLGYLVRTKQEVRQLCDAFPSASTTALDAAVWQRLSTKKTSTGLCFVGEATAKRSQQPGGDRIGRTGTPACSRSHRGAKELHAPPSCSHAFAGFLQGYMPPVGARRKANGEGEVTRFVELLEGSTAVREIPAEHFRWTGALGCGAGAPLASLLPAYAFTVGQRLRCFPDASSDKGARTLYVLEKLLCDHDDDDGGEGAGIKEVRLVARWNHPLFFARDGLRLRGVQWHVDPRLLGAQRGAAEGLWCLGCTRHLEALRPCLLQLTAPDAAATDASDAEVVRVRVDPSGQPFRAVAAGQLFVGYLPLSHITAARAPPLPPLPPARKAVDDGHGGGTQGLDHPLVVVMSGWVTS